MTNPYGPSPIEPARPVFGDGRWQAGAHVWIEWRGTWWAGTVVQPAGEGLYRVHYTGWSESYDETVTAHRLAPYDRPPPGPKARSGPTPVGGLLLGIMVVALVVVAGLVAVGSQPTTPPSGSLPIATIEEVRVEETVWIDWHGTWYSGSIVSVDVAHRTARVHYDGYDGDDEDVSLDRLRTR
jgi:hypothetical protein